MEFIKHFPYPEMRDVQRASMEVLEKEWDNYDVFVLNAPTSYGKTAVAETLMRALGSVSVITPTNLLVEQFLEEFPRRTLRRLDSYCCSEWGNRPCSVTKGKLLKFCKGCPAGGDLATAKYRRGPGVYNYHVYIAQKLYRDTLVVDEAHNLIPFLRDRFAVRLWMHDYKYPEHMRSPEQMKAWVGSLTPAKRKNRKVQQLDEALNSRHPTYVIERKREEYNGKGTARGEPEMRDCLKLLPIALEDQVPIFWPRGEVKKTILLSATISKKDIETLGLHRRKVLYINCESPIPAANRPVLIDDVMSVNRQTFLEATVGISHYIQDVLAPRHEGEKGIIHATYQQAEIFKSILLGPRYLFHDRSNKRDVYRRYRESNPTEGRILVASGMYEGIDLPEDMGRWQCITKIPWPSLGDAAVKYRADKDPDWYAWETWRTVIQACGRICRTPTDTGLTYILDGSIHRLFQDADHLIPEWFRDALYSGDELLKTFGEYRTAKVS